MANRQRLVALWCLTGLAGLGLWLVLGWVTLPSGRESSLCLLRRTLDLPCPGCGLSRAVAALARGEWAQAMSFHPLAPLLALEAAVAWGLWGMVLLGGWKRVSSRPWMEGWLLGHVGVLVSLWVGRLATGTLPW